MVYNLFGTQTASYAIGGSGSLTKLGQGSLVLGGSNGYTGGTTLTAGVLAINNASAWARAP